MKVRYRPSRRLIAAALAAMVLVTIVITLPRVARGMKFFRVRQVEVVGCRFLDQADVAARLGLRRDASIWDALPPIRRAAAAIPGVIQVSVERRLPGTLRVVIHEATPVALVAVADRLTLVDYRGHVLPFDPTRLPTSLPVATRDTATAVLLGRLLLTDPLLYTLVESAYADHGDVVLELGPQRIRMRPGADQDAIRAVTIVRAYLAAHHRDWLEIDGRYLGWVFVTKTAAVKKTAA